MIRDLGIVEPGKTLYIPFHTFDSNDPSASVTLTGLATTDIEIYKDGSVTQRASDSGYALLDTDGIDFAAVTGIHGISIDLADNTTAGFYAAGSQYWVVVASVTVDAATVNFVLCTFRIGYQAARLSTTIATLASQTSFTLTVGPAEDDALNGFWCIIHDVASAVQQGHAIISDYTGSTKTVTLAAGTTFTAAATDNIAIMGPMPMQPTVAGRTLDVSTGGEAGVDWANIGSPTTPQNLSATNIDVDQIVASVSGAVGSVTGAVGSVTGLTAATVHSDLDDIQARLPAALVGGRIDASVGAMAASVMTAAAAAADLTTELQSGLATAAALDAVDNFIDTEIAAIITTLGTPAGASVSADIAAIKTETAAILVDTDVIGATGQGLTTLATQASVNTIDDFLDTEVAAILAAVDTEVAAILADTDAMTTTGVAVATGGIATTSFAAGAIDAAALATDAGAEVADAILLRKLDRTGTGTDVAQERTVVNALRALRNKVSVVAGTATITKENDTDAAWTAAVGTTAGDPISSVDPT